MRSSSDGGGSVTSSVTSALTSAVDAFAELDPTGLCISELQSVLTALTPALGRLAGMRSDLLGELQARSGGTVPSTAGPDGAPGPDIAVRHWLRDMSGCDASAAARAVRTAMLLRSLPQVAAAVRDGRLGPAQAAVLTRLVGQIEPDALTEAEPALIALAAHRDPQELAKHVSHLLATWCEPQFEADMRSQENKRYLQSSRETDGMLTGRFRLTAADSEVLLSLLEPLARRTGLADPRTAGQRRADALTEICALGLRFADLPDAGGHRPQLSYVMPAGWAAAHAQTAHAAGQPTAGHPVAAQPTAGHPAGTFADLITAALPTDSTTPARPTDPASSDPATGGAAGPGLPAEYRCAIGVWSGPQTRSLIETILCDARISRVLLDSVGQVRGLEALRDTVTKAQRQALVARDHGCAARGCTRPPAFCDAHHLTHLADGGATDNNNLVLLCRRHPIQWHQGRLQLRDLHVPWLQPTLTGHDPP